MASGVKDYYTNVLKSTKDIKTDVCTSSKTCVPRHIRNIIEQIHEDVLNKYYGCGLPIPHSLENCRVLDIGCGAGRDCFLLSNLVGSGGFVVGLDMTEDMLAVAKNNVDYHKEKFGFPSANVDFVLANIQDSSILSHPLCPVKSFDVIVSNCVINLTDDKKSVLSNVFQLLKDGGEFYFSDIYSSDAVPDSLQKDKVMWGECISGALYWKDFLEICKSTGLAEPLFVSATPVLIGDCDIGHRIAEESTAINGTPLKFASVTYRVVKLSDGSEQSTEPCSYSATYLGGIFNGDQEQDTVKLDYFHNFKKDEERQTSSGLARFIQQSRFARYFNVIAAKGKPCSGDLQQEQCVNPFVVLKM